MGGIQSLNWRNSNPNILNTSMLWENKWGNISNLSKYPIDSDKVKCIPIKTKTISYVEITENK